MTPIRVVPLCRYHDVRSIGRCRSPQSPSDIHSVVPHRDRQCAEALTSRASCQSSMQCLPDGHGQAPRSSAPTTEVAHMLYAGAACSAGSRPSMVTIGPRWSVLTFFSEPHPCQPRPTPFHMSRACRVCRASVPVTTCHHLSTVGMQHCETAASPGRCSRSTCRERACGRGSVPPFFRLQAARFLGCNEEGKATNSALERGGSDRKK